jgi:hypothetical protein
MIHFLHILFIHRWYLPEVAHPYDEFNAAGLSITFASPKGGVAPVDEGSIAATAEDPACVNFYKEGSATRALVDSTVKISEVTDVSGYDAVFFAGGFGTMWCVNPSSCSPLFSRKVLAPVQAPSFVFRFFLTGTILTPSSFRSQGLPRRP